MMPFDSWSTDRQSEGIKGGAHLKSYLAILAVLVFWVTSSAYGCGDQSDCIVGDRFYRIHVPPASDPATKMPALVFAHGYQGTAAGVMKNQALMNWADREGVAVIAAQSDGPGWDLPYGPRTFDSDGVSEETYFDAVVSDAVAKFPLDRSRIVMSGFSAGGMMTWHLACSRPDLFAGFIPIAGTFWLKPPKSCKRPVKSLIHIHGNMDTVVPFEGRQIDTTHQGSIFDAFALYQSIGLFDGMESLQEAGLFCQAERNPESQQFLFCRFDGGHEFRVHHLAFAWKRLINHSLD
jgi:polyhydroxybutyrate depolymerase